MLTGLLVGILPVDCVAVCLLNSSDKDASAVGKPCSVCSVQGGQDMPVAALHDPLQ